MLIAQGVINQPNLPKFPCEYEQFKKEKLFCALYILQKASVLEEAFLPVKKWREKISFEMASTTCSSLNECLHKGYPIYQKVLPNHSEYPYS